MPRPPRAEPLPTDRPKSRAEDTLAPHKLARILEHPSYRPADRDPDFMQADTTRGVRLQIDYLKTESELARLGIQHTIVVFGGTRILEPAAAREQVQRLELALENDPADARLRARLERARRLQAKSIYYDVARELGRLVANSGNGPRDCRLVIMTGGGPGIMEAANRGADDAGAKSVGLNIDLPREQFPNPYVTPELCFRFHYFALRKLHFLLRARALVAFPGGYGTLDEIFETLTLVQTRKIPPIPVILVGESYWRRVFDVDFLVDEGTIDPEDRELFSYCDDAAEIWARIRRWYTMNGAPLCGGDCD